MKRIWLELTWIDSDSQGPVSFAYIEQLEQYTRAQYLKAHTEK